MMIEYSEEIPKHNSKKLTLLQKKFATEKDLKHERDAKKKRGEIDRQEGITGEVKSLYEQLAENSRIAEQEFIDKTKFSNLIYSLNVDECAFIKDIDEKMAQAELKREVEEKEELEKFRNASQLIKKSHIDDFEEIKNIISMEPERMFSKSENKTGASISGLSRRKKDSTMKLALKGVIVRKSKNNKDGK